MTTIVLPARCDRAAAAALLPDFITALGGDEVTVDATRAEQVGQAMLQVLVSARASFSRFAIQPSDALREAARLTGLGTHLFEDDAS